jgi:hypothetical protein
MRSRLLAALALACAVPAVPIDATPLSLAWGAIAEPATEGVHTPGHVAEHLEFLQAHGWRAVRSRDLQGADPGDRSVLLSFDDPASALRYVVPLLDLYQTPAVVTVGPEQAADSALAPVLASLAASPWVELLPRVEEPLEGAAVVRCGAGAADPAGAEQERLTRLSRTLADQVARLRTVTGAAPSGVVWSPGTWSGAGERVAAALGLTVQLPTFTNMPPVLSPPRVARYEIPVWAGIWALVQASVHWDPQDFPVRFVEVDAAWVCAGGDPEARVARIVDVVRRLGLNGVRILPGGAEGAWFPTTAAPVRGDVAGPLARTLREAGVRWVVADLPTAGGNPGRSITLATDLARAVDLDVVVLPAGARPEDRLGEAVRAVRPAAQLARRDRETGERSFHLEPLAPGRPASRGLTIVERTVAATDAVASRRAVAGWEWIGLPIDRAEAGLAVSLRSLAAFALPR